MEHEHQGVNKLYILLEYIITTSIHKAIQYTSVKGTTQSSH